MFGFFFLFLWQDFFYHFHIFLSFSDLFVSGFFVFYELCFVFDFVYDDCQHVYLFRVLFLYCFE